MKKIISLMLFIALAASLLSFNSFAQSLAVVDDADLFTTEQEQALTERIDEIRDYYDFDITFITTTDTYGETLENYAEFHYALDLSRDGLVFAQDTSMREYMTISREDVFTVVTDQALDRIDDVIVPYLSDGDYYGAYDRYLDLSIDFLDAAESGVPYAGEPIDGTDIVIALVIGLGVGLVIAFVVTGIMISKMNTAVKKREAGDYIKQNSFLQGPGGDRFIREHTTKTPIPKNNSSSGGSRGGGSFSSGGRGGGRY